MTPAARWFLLIAALTIAAPYLLGVKPRTRRQWFYVVVTIAFLTWILPFMASLRANLRDEDGLPLFRKMQAALGGAERIAAVRDFEQLTVAESFNGNTGQSVGEVRKRTRWIRPNYLRVDQVGQGSTYVLYFDGTSGWEILPGTHQVVELTGGELEFARGMVRGFRLNTWVADRDSRYSITSPAPNVVRLSDGDITHQLDITADPASMLPQRITFTTLSDPAHPVTGQDVTTEWATVKGIRVPRRWTVLRSGLRVAEAKDATTAIDTGLQVEDLAAKPADLKPVMSGR